ncbi:CCN family member 1-like [Stegodyphus dumicola]|uniref:CCN family member 1-like n=1 Tax=Stegodyphus dumicola TaxID=202533 RepID=UPI0015AC5092|nr:CCN family member 1-like [Stegodyphus dumicola]
MRVQECKEQVQEMQGTSMIDDRSFRCPETCRCPETYPQCQDGVPVVIDGCGCCPVCARQQGDICNSVQVCDVTRKLQCIYADPFSTSGICRVRRGQGCHVGQSNYRDGETFKLDCRTQCTCQNGTYGCVSLCPHENVRPSSKCHHPQLVKMHESCCREWLCDSTLMEDRKKHCQSYTSEWTPCSTTCGMGISSRISNDNPECELKNETRLCLLRPCPSGEDLQLITPHGHHVRKNHVCRATVRSTTPIRLTDDGNCTSVELYQPKYCGYCTSHHCCHPKVTTSKKIQFKCIDEEGTNIMQKEVLWIIKCNCTTVC